MERPRGMVAGAGGLQLPTAATPQSVRRIKKESQSRINVRRAAPIKGYLDCDRRAIVVGCARGEGTRKETASCVKKTDRVAFPWSVRGHLRGHLETLNSLEIGATTSGSGGALSNPINRTN